MKQLKTLILLTSLFVLTPSLLFATIWNTAGDGLSATTSPSPYDNYTNITTSLTISGATQLNVTVIGTIEDDYDFLYITDEAGNTRTFDGNINDTYTVTGSTVTLNFVSDYSITSTGLTVSIVDSTPPSIMDAFSVKYTTNLKGNIKTIGNTVLEFTGTIGTNANSHLNLSYVDIDGVASTFNSSSADIGTIEAGVDISSARVRWAGLYWQSYLHTWDPNDGGNSNNRYTSLNTLNSINNIIDTHSISFTTPSGAFSVRPSEIGKKQITNLPLNFDGNQWNAPGYNTISYSCFADVTNLLQGQAPNGTYTVANIPSQQGRTASVDSFSVGNTTWYDGLGNYGAWTLVVIYDNNATVAEKTRNITVFDGYTEISGANNPSETISLSGFKTPSSTPNGVDSTISIFASEGDRNILGDLATLTNQDGYTYILPDTSGAGSYFASVIEGVPIRNPLLVNNQGIDIHTTQVGTSGGADRPIKENQTSASVTLSTATTGTSRDTYYPSMVAFATELFTPKLCYDYDVRMGEYVKINSENREIHTNRWDDDFTLTMLIRSEISDFPINDTKLNVTFTPSTLNYISNSSEVSPPDVNIYKPIGELAAGGQIGIGRGATDSSGGVIGAYESTYAKQKFSFGSTSRFDGKFDIHIEGNILFDPNALPVPYVLSTAAPVDSPSHIPRCATNPVYNPIWTNFNIERPDSDPSQPAQERYPLYTQIAGKDFNISVVSYTANDPDGVFDDPFDSNATVELEIINASVFENNASAGYDSTCEEPGAIGNGAFINFADSSGNTRSRVNVQIPDDIPNFNNDFALQSAAFRLWILTTKDINGTKSIVHHSCRLDGTTPNCFVNLYRDRISSYDANGTGECQTRCAVGSTEQDCYDCLRENFATPICSRDNFSIRPESFRVRISDNNESNTTAKQRLTDNSTNATIPNHALAAEYQYAIEVNSTLFNNTLNSNGEAHVRGYYNEFFEADENLTDAELGSKTTDNIVAALEFQDSNSPSCNDKTHRTFKFRLQNGQLDDNLYIHHNNVGNYNYWMLDSNWTNVDQSGYPLKTRFGDCVVGDTRPVCTDCDTNNPSNSIRNNDGKLGCVINSNLDDGNTQTKIDNYIEIPLRMEPYAYDVSDINISLPNNSNVLYMNDLNTNNIISRSMAVRFNGPLKAIGKKGAVLSNHTNTCAARPVLFDINRTLTQNNVPTNENSIRSINLESMTPSVRVGFQRYDNSENTNPATRFATENNETNASTSVIVNAIQFKDSDKGSAILRLEYNFQRPCCQVVNPLSMQFNLKEAEANSTLSISSAHLTNHTPDGNASIGRNVNFLYGRIAPNSSAIYTVPPSQSSTSIPMFPEAYCSGLDTNGSLIDCSIHTLTTPSQRDAGSWWVNTNHNSLQGDGQINALYEYAAPYPLSITPDGGVNPIDLNNPTAITITINAGVSRPYTSPIIVVPSVPWLGYNPNRAGGLSGNPSATPRPGCTDPSCGGGGGDKDGPGSLDPIVIFQGGGGWAGKGNTGLVVDTNASADAGNKRTSW